MGNSAKVDKILIHSIEVKDAGRQKSKKVEKEAHIQCWKTLGRSTLSWTYLDTICPIRSPHSTGAFAREDGVRVFLFISSSSGASSRPRTVEVEVELADLAGVDIALNLTDFSMLFPHRLDRSPDPGSAGSVEAKARNRQITPRNPSDPRKPVPALVVGGYGEPGQRPTSPLPTEPWSTYPQSVQPGSSLEDHPANPHQSNAFSGYPSQQLSTRQFDYDHLDPTSDAPPVSWRQVESYASFYENTQAHEFWDWDKDEMKWKHVDQETGEVLYCPDELD